MPVRDCPLLLTRRGDASARLRVGLRGLSAVRVDDRCMASDLDARTLIDLLIGRQISTVRGRPKGVLGEADGNMVVGTDRSPEKGALLIDSV